MSIEKSSAAQNLHPADNDAFYDHTTDAEGKRLDEMAQQVGDVLSARLIREALGSVNGRSVLDVGAGDSIGLGESLRREGVLYIPCDRRPEAVQAQQAAGAEHAFVSEATSLDFPPDTVDSVHFRATMAWLDDEARERAFLEALRVCREAPSVVVLDYDWHTAVGPQPFMTAIAKTCDILAKQGFAVGYGAQVRQDMQRWARQYFAEGSYEVGAEDRQVYTAPLAEAESMIAMSAGALVAQLEELDMKDDAAVVKDALAQLSAYAAGEGQGDEVTMPHLVGVRLTVASKADALKPATARILERHEVQRQRRNLYLEEGVDFVRPEYLKAPGLENVAIAVSERAIQEARSVQADRYEAEGMIDPETGRKSDGTLTDEIDSPELVARSVYFVTMGDSGRITGVIRIIRPGDAGAETQPTMTHGIYDDVRRDLEDKQVVEVSAFAPASSGQPIDAIKATVAAARYVRQMGYDVGVMSMRDDKKHFFMHVFGKGNFEQIGDVVSAGEVTGAASTLRFVPLRVDAQQFIGQVHRYAAERKGPVFAELAEMTADTETEPHAA